MGGADRIARTSRTSESAELVETSHDGHNPHAKQSAYVSARCVQPLLHAIVMY